MSLMEERIANPEIHNDKRKPAPAEFEDSKLYHYAIFSVILLPASVVVNSAIKNSKEPWKHKHMLILFLDDDIVVQRDLTGLWKIDMDGKVNGVVETCFGLSHIYAQYLNFLLPLIKAKSGPACALAYGMNFFYLDAWTKEKCREEYHYWQNLTENRTLWKLQTFPPDLITFYLTTKPLGQTRHALGLEYNPNIRMEEVQNAAVEYNPNHGMYSAL
ncbi:Galacturonosyltransferase 8 [Citrus sinensis]|uniref:Galacturonosyltransferase 8 n=1 Tax=Citrus sinensis TaxID=2711 RepID=A0ACB8JCG5_CITSI|nr:Galacturonosyltransferase 8 [Citrus sinensis]